MLVDKAVRAAPAELGGPQVPHAAQHACDAPAWPPDAVFNLWEAARLIGRRSKCVQKFTHQHAAAVVEALDLTGVIHRVVGRVLHPFGLTPGARHRLRVAPALCDDTGWREGPDARDCYRDTVPLSCLGGVLARLACLP